jgi:hypothetical protein
VSALAVVNAVGDVIDPPTGKIVAGAATQRPIRVSSPNGALLVRGGTPAGFSRRTNTLVAVATNAAE